MKALKIKIEYNSVKKLVITDNTPELTIPKRYFFFSFAKK